MEVPDRYGRPLRNLRLSVTDRCNLRCAYCMPEPDYVWLPKPDLLTFGEIDRLVGVFLGLGVDRLRITGGEPLLRQDLHELVARIARHEALRDLAMTTNGVLLAEKAEDLRRAGLMRLTVSLDSLDADRFRRLTRRDDHAKVLAGLEHAAECGFDSLKIDTVVMRGVNDDELDAMLDLGRRFGAEVRFIEYMDVGGATDWSMDKVVSRDEMMKALSRTRGPITPIPDDSSAPARRYALADGTVFGIISSTTAPFCARCDRSRLTADGHWFLCLYATNGYDLRAPLRAGASDREIASLISRTWEKRADRGAEERLGLTERRPLAASDDLKSNPHLEMHTRGG